MTPDRPAEADLLGDGLRLAAEHLPHLVWTAHPDGRLATLNERWRVYTGWTLAATREAGWEAVVHPDDLPSCRERWTGAVALGAPYETAARLRRADGAYRWHLARATPVRTSADLLVGWLGTWTDIDDQLTAEASQRTAILETALDAIITMDATGRIVEFNPAAVQIFGYPRARAVGQTLADLIIPPDLRDQHRAGLATYLATGEGPLIGRRIEVLATRADGALFPVELAITRVPRAGPPLFTGYLRDISDRVRLDEERAVLLTQSLAQAAQLGATFDAITDGVVVVDAAGRITKGNDAIRDLFGVDVATVVARAPSAEPVLLYTPLDDAGQPLPRDAWPRYRILRGEVLTGAHAVDTHAFVRDGRLAHLNVTGAPLRDAAGQVTGGVMVMRDVTDRRQLEQRTHAALGALLAMAEVLIEGTDVAAAVPDVARSASRGAAVAQRLVELIRDVLGCRRVSISTRDAPTGLFQPLAITGLSPDEERAWRERPAAAPLESIDPELAARLLAGEVVLFDMDASPMRGRPNPFGVRAVLAALLRIGSQPVGLLALDYGGEEHRYTPDERALTAAVAQLAAVVIERDRLLREREEARAGADALREANRRMDEFLGIAGHEMRTPLTTIKGSLQLAQRRLDRVLAGDDPVRGTDELGVVKGLLDRTDTQLGRLTRLVDDVLDVSRIRAGHLEIRRAPCDLAALVRDVVDEQRQRVGSRTILLEGADRGRVLVEADADRIAQVLINYLTNALKYSEAGQPVTAGLALGDDTARVWVRDAGPGIAPDEQERIWERFYRVAETTHRHGSSVGLGMGLHICRTIIARHGGQVGVESASGHGATFWFTLPRQADG